jgi:ATP-dependent DNA helicase PIF1
MNNAIKKKRTNEKENKFLESIIKQIQKEDKINHEQYTKVLKEFNTVRLSEEQEKILELAKNGESFFLTGNAGTGKSVLLVEIIKALKEKYSEKKNTVFVTASTGIAGVNIGGCTIHSLTGIGNGEAPVDDLIKIIRRNKNASSTWKNADAFVIDEISMLSSEIFTKLNEIGKTMRNDTRPFGGIQIIVCGHFYQLPPVTKEGPIQFCFDSIGWNEGVKKTYQLTFCYRQKGDQQFREILNQVMTNTLSSSNEKVLLSRLKSNIKDYKEDPKYVTLFPDKNSVNKKNISQYNKLDGKEEKYIWTANNGMKDTVDWCNVQKELSLKKGCQVMLVKNLDFKASLVNGSVGTVEGFCENTGYPIVRFTHGVTRVIGAEDFSLKKGEVTVSSIKQVPLILAWAITIHKSQGMTFDYVEMDLSYAFEYHQVYVALSRATSLKGLVLIGFNKNKIKVHSKVIEFHKKLNKTL